MTRFPRTTHPRWIACLGALALVASLSGCSGELVDASFGAPEHGTDGGERFSGGDDSRAAATPPVSPDGLDATRGGDEECNGYDDNDDGRVDEGCYCSYGAVQDCYPGPETSAIRGACQRGQQTCSLPDEFGTWGPCEGAVTPADEICGDGIDQDCTGDDEPCTIFCGDRLCDGSETCETCPGDCGACRCGDGTCNGSETCDTCPGDCGACRCGDGTCNGSETCDTCPGDCGACRCGDGTCNGSETCDTCPGDCGACPCESFTLAVNSRPVDIVWVIDQSGSMAGEIAMVRAKMNDFSAYISSVQSDYRVVVLAGKSGIRPVCIDPPLGGPSCTDGPRFKHVDQHIESHDGLKLTAARITDIESFLRPHSLRHFVVVTDDDSRQMAADAFDSFLRGRQGYGDYLLHGVVGLQQESGITRVGEVYIDLATRTGGLLFHIANADWTQLFGRLGQEVADLALSQYVLSRQAVADTVTVTYDGAPAVAGTQWTYVASNHMVELQGTLPPANTTIEVCYHPQE